jgi:hypothetical protein
MAADDPRQLPSQTSLDALFASARRARIGEVFGPVLLDVEGADVQSLQRALRIHEDDEPFACGCEGELAITLLGSTGPLATLAFHHAFLLANPAAWLSQGRLVDGRALLHWLAERGFRGPLERQERIDREDAQRERAFRTWVTAAPPCLHPEIPELNAGVRSEAIYERSMAALAAAHPSIEERACVLLSWFSFAARGKWSGAVPGNERIPADLLTCLGTAAILRGLARGPVPREARLGAARYFATLANGKRALVAVPDELWASLLEAVRRAGIADNLRALEATVATAREQRRRDADPRPLVSPEGVVTAGISSDADRFDGLVLSGGRPNAIDHPTLVRFESGSTIPVPLAILPAGSEVFEADDEGIYFFTQTAEGTTAPIVARLDNRAGSAARVLTRGQKSITSPVVVRGHVYWLDESPETSLDERSGERWHAPEILRAPLSGGAPKALARLGSWAGDLVAEGDDLAWVECDVVGEGRIVVMPAAGGAGRRIAEARTEGWPQRGQSLVMRAGRVLWIEPDEKRVRAVALSEDGASTLAALSRPPRAIVADARHAYVITGEALEEPATWHVERISLDTGAVTRVASFTRMPYEQPRMALDAFHVYWTHRDRILMFSRPESPTSSS